MIQRISQVKNKIQDIVKSEFVINVSTLMSGSVISQIIPFLVAPIISRLYYPEDYALVAAYNSITVLFTIVATGMYSSALMIDKTDEEAFNTSLAAFIITIATTVASLFLLFFFSDIISSLVGNENITFWLYLIPLTVFFTGGYQTLNMWNNRLKRYKILAFNKIFQTIVTSGATLLFGLLSYHSTGLMLSLLLGQAFAFFVLLFQTIRYDSSFSDKTNYNKIKSSFIRHKDFPKYNMPQGFLDGFRESSIVLIISNFFGPVVLGSYSFAMGMLNKPMQFIGNSFSQVYYQKASVNYKNGMEIWEITKKTMHLLSIISLPFFFTLLIYGEQIFTIFFGSKWEQAGFYAQILVVWLLFKFIISSFSSVPLILKQQKRFFQFSILNNILPPAVLLLGSIILNDFKVVLIFFVAVNTAIIFIMLLWIRSISIQKNIIQS